MGGCCAMDNPVGDFFRSIKDAFSGGGGCGYTPRVSKTEEHSRIIANELAEMKEKYSKIAEKEEKRIMDDITSSMNSFLNQLEAFNKKSYGGKVLDIDINAIKSKNSDLSKEVLGHIGQVIEDRIVQTDKELSVILKEENDKKRGKNFKEFCNDVLDEAISSLKSPITKSIKKQQQLVVDEIQQRLKEITVSSEKALDALTDIQEQKEKGDFGCDAAKIDCMYKVGLYDLILAVLEE